MQDDRQEIRLPGLDPENPRHVPVLLFAGRVRRWLTGREGVLLGWTVLACLILILFVDEAVARWCAALPEDVRRFFGKITHMGKSEPWLFGGFALFVYFRYFYRNRHLAARAGFVLLAVAAAGIAVNIVKLVFGRARPDKLFSDPAFFGFYPPGLDSHFQSFPSGHTTTSVAVALCMMTFWPRLWPLWAAFAFLVASSRVVIGAHYPADLVAATFLTWLVTRYIRQRLEGNGFRLRVAPAPVIGKE